MSQEQIEFLLIRHGALIPRGKSGDPTMAHSIVEDSSTGHSTQPAMSGNTRELATSLVEMKIASGDLPMADAGASQGEDKQQPPGDALESLNPDPPSNYPRMVWEDVHFDSMNVDALPMDLAANAGDEVDSVEDHLLEARHHEQVQGEVPLTGDGDAEQEQIDLSSRDCPMGEVQEEAPLTREGDAEQEQSVPSLGDPLTSEDDEEAPLTREGASQEEQCDPSSGGSPDD